MDAILIMITKQTLTGSYCLSKTIFTNTRRKYVLG